MPVPSTSRFAFFLSLFQQTKSRSTGENADLDTSCVLYEQIRDRNHRISIGVTSMAVEARHLNLFTPHVLTNRDLVMNSGVVEANGNMFGAPMYGVVSQISGTEAVFPMYGTSIAGGFPAKDPAAMKSDSGVTFVPAVSRKRSRDSTEDWIQSASNYQRSSFTFLGEDLTFQIQQQQLEIDRFIAHHTEKVRMEIEERRKIYSSRIAAAVEEHIMKEVKAKEEEIEKIGRLNYALEERVKSLSLENQIWRDLAQTNEATANALRCNLEQVLAHVHDDRHHDDDGDTQSCCGSNYNFIETDNRHHTGSSTAHVNDSAPPRLCRSCAREESCVLLLPCRHLCLCTVCGSSVHTCPVCNTTKTASVHVNLSPPE